MRSENVFQKRSLNRFAALFVNFALQHFRNPWLKVTFNSVTCLHFIQKFCKRAINMPLMPNVPHIVGDDDDLSEADDQAQIATPCTVGDPSSQERKTAESPSSELTESSYDNDSEADEEDTNNSTAEEEDWSNNISYIVRTPEREPEQLTVDGSPKVADVQLPEDTAQTENNEAVDHTEDMDTEDADTQPATRPERLAPSERSSPMEENSRTNDAISVNSTPEMESELATRDSELEDSSADKPHTSRPTRLKDSPPGKPSAVEYFSPPSRRQSLRSANRTSQSQSQSQSQSKAVPQPAAKTSRSRQRKSKSSTDCSPAKRIGARVAKRPRQSLSLTLNKSPVKKPDSPLARPVEVTEYFTSISATLVSHRVNLLPFLYMRKRIDRLVGEAIAKTRIQRENNPVNAV
ncbi:uncharacterized protein LOC115759013 [Drosophila novamexicana]|uniref:uncharacterized protein LOC115759013 n=1 Tax=Drosophila novamexicana TaxID=47314 RepID=UPI0011E60498|nr:uncharacterized protein LOC115759013 [Drosophila novamexicana]